MNTDMRWRWALVLLALGAAAARAKDSPSDAGDDDTAAELALDQEESRNLGPRAFPPAAYNALPTGFRPTPSLAELAGYRAVPAQAPAHQQRPQPQPQPQSQPQRQQQQQQRQHQQQQQQQLEEEEEEEQEQPDRLAQLLQQSRFECVGKQSGYYADQELGCEVFHYCQDSVKHSWICPEGFSFHQVHLICMPPTHDNICQKSAKYHFVNEYLYRPINEEEVQRKPNVSLRYSDRYYPAEVYHDDRYDDEDEDEEEADRPHRTQQQHQQQQQQQQQRQRQERPAQRLPAPPVSPASQAPQVFRSAEEVNIPLGQRRPQRPYDFDF